MEDEMTVVKPSKDHPWNESIQSDVDRARLRARILGVEKRIDELKRELKALKNQLASKAVSK
jgi:hypothetical protein